MKSSIVFICLITVSACASVNNDDFYYDEILLRNYTKSNVNDIVISVKDSGGVFSCSFIPPGGECSSKFQKRKLLGHPITVNWMVDGITRSTDSFFVKVPDTANKDFPLTGVLVIVDNNSIKAYLEQN